MKKIIISTLIVILVILGMYLRPTGASEYCNFGSEYGFIDSSCWGMSLILDRSLYSSNPDMEFELKVPIHIAGRLSVLTKEKASSYWLNYNFRYGSEDFSSGLIVSAGSKTGGDIFIERSADEGRYTLIRETNSYIIYQDSNNSKSFFYFSKLSDFFMSCEVNCWFQGVINDRFLVKYGFPKKWLETTYDPLVIPSLVITSILKNN